MFSGSKLKELEEAKQLLIAQAELHRSMLRMEAAGWTSRLARIQGVRDSLMSYKGIIMTVAAGAGLIAATRGRSVFRWIPTALSMWRSVRGILKG